MKVTRSLLLAVFLSIAACSGLNRTVLREDFIDSEFPEDSTLVPQAIDSTIQLLADSGEDPSVHRRLAVLYRMQGTPYSRKNSIAEIEKAISLAPLDPVNYVEKALTLHAMQFDHQAEKSFRKAIEIDPGYFYAWYHLGVFKEEKYLRNMCFEDDADEAIRCFKKAYEINDRDKKTLFDLGLLTLLRRGPQVASRYVERLVSLYGSDPRVHLLAGTLFLRSQEFDKAGQEFTKALSLMGPDERIIYTDTGILLPKAEWREHLSWTQDKRTEWDSNFWLMHDPTPATPINERLLEHFERVFLSRELLTNKRLGLEGDLTARGQALIKYGLPDRILYRLGEGQDGPMTIWNYARKGARFKLYFVDEFMNGDFHIPIDRKFSGIARMTESIMDDYPEAYRYPVDAVDVTLYSTMVQKRGLKGQTLLEFAAAVPDSVFSGSSSRYRIILSVFDNGLGRILNDIIPVRPDTALIAERDGRRYRVFPLSCELLPRALECSYAIGFSGGNPAVRGTARGFFDMIDFSSGDLTVSDIKISLHDPGGACTAVPDPIPGLPQGARLCVAYGIYGLHMGKDGMARYRLTYTIRDDAPGLEELEGLSKTLAYMKNTVRGGEKETSPYITSSLEQGTGSRDASDMLEIDTRSLKPGKYLLILKIEDLTDGRSVFREKPLVISGPGGQKR